MKKNLIVTLADENYIEQAKQLFSSAYWNAGWAGDYLLLAHEIPEEKLVWFRQRGILIHHCAPLVDKKIGTGHHPATVFSKLYLLKTYFRGWGKIIFLDADIIVRSSLDALLNVSFFAAPNATGILLRDEFLSGEQTADHPAARRLRNDMEREFSLAGKAFNTGVFVFDTEKVISERSFNEVIGLVERFGDLSVHGEEATLNLLFHKKWKPLAVVYNMYPRYMRDRLHVSDHEFRAIAVHFVLSPKPWTPESPYHAEWTENYKRADAIDTSRPQAAASVWTRREIARYGRFIRRRELSQSKFALSLRRGIRRSWYCIDSSIGKVGLMIKRKSPTLYEKIRRQ